MSQSLVFPFLIFFVSFGGLSFDSFLEYPRFQSGYPRYSWPGRLDKPKYECFGFTTWADRFTPSEVSQSRFTPSALSQRVENVNVFGAKPNYDGDDSQAFEKAWNTACSTGSVLLVPENSVYYLKPITFSGPCKPNTAFTIHGTIIAWPDMSAYENTEKSGLKFWIMFNGITNLRVDGGGLIDGNGKKWWMNSCKINKSLPCKDAPTIIDTIFRDLKNTPCRTCRIPCLLKCLGFARNIRFMNIEMQNVSNPIFIDQNYCDQSTPCPEQGSAVELSDVRYQNIKGKSASEVAIKLHCSKSIPCKGLYMQDVVLTPVDGGDIEASCENVEYVNRGKLYPQCVPA